jgi:hypothetical protein
MTRFCTSLPTHWRRLPLPELEDMAALTFGDSRKADRLQRRINKLRRRQKRTGDPKAAGVTV